MKNELKELRNKKKGIRTLFSFLFSLNDRRGNAWVGLLLILTFVMTLGLALVSSVVLSIAQTKRSGQVMIAQSLCDGGIEKAIWKINSGATYTGENGLSMPTGTLDIAITNLDAQNRSIIATAYVPSKANPKVTRQVRAKIKAVPSSEDVAFHYALQAGEGGIHVSGSSTVYGTLYSNGDIDFTGGGYRITGDAYAHGTVIPNPNPRVTGTIVNGAPIVPLPDIDIETWKQLAIDGGTHVGNYSPPSGTTIIGPKTITGNLTMTNSNQILKLRGPLYVQGTINLSGGQIIIDDVLGTSGTILMADGIVGVGGGTKFIPNAGGGNTLVISTNNHTTAAITYSGSAESEALAMYAPIGGMTLAGSGNIVATCGETLTLSGNGDIHYNSGLADANFSAGPGGSWKVIEWQIIH